MCQRKPMNPKEDFFDPALPINLADWATSMLATARQADIPTNRYSCKVALSLAQRRTILDLEINDEIRELLSSEPTGIRTFNFTADELIEICHAIARPLVTAKGKHRNQLLKAAEKVTQGLTDGLTSRPKPRKKAKRRTAYQLKITLEQVRPVVWRRFQALDCTLTELHKTVQVVMGWQNKHPYCFRVGEQAYSDPPLCEDLGHADGRRVKLSHLVKQGLQQIEYVYDFGDNWRHTVEIESGFEPEEKASFPMCLEGRGTCPPEDVGGPLGYADFLEVINNPNHDRHRELLDWCGGWFDPEAFDLELVNRGLGKSNLM